MPHFENITLVDSELRRELSGIRLEKGDSGTLGDLGIRCTEKGHLLVNGKRFENFDPKKLVRISMRNGEVDVQGTERPKGLLQRLLGR